MYTYIYSSYRYKCRSDGKGGKHSIPTCDAKLQGLEPAESAFHGSSLKTNGLKRFVACTYLLEGGHGQCLRLLQCQRVAVTFLEVRLRPLTARPNGLAFVSYEEPRRVAEEQLRAQIPSCGAVARDVVARWPMVPSTIQCRATRQGQRLLE